LNALACAVIGALSA